jgi:hypothetical protein
LASKLSKSAAGYLSAKLVGTERIGTCCMKCRDFIEKTSECLITDDSKVSGPHGTCTQFLRGQPYYQAKPMRIVPKEVVGYIEDDKSVPTFCGQCSYYLEHGRMTGGCEKVEGSIDYGGCCNLYEYQVKK